MRLLLLIMATSQFAGDVGGRVSPSGTRNKVALLLMKARRRGFIF